MSAAADRLAAALADVIAEAVAAATSVGTSSPVPPADFTVAQLAARFSRTASCIRGWLEAGKFSGAYKLNSKDWRIPLADVLAFEAAQRAQPVAQAVVSLSAWRRARNAKPARRRRKVAS